MRRILIATVISAAVVAVGAVAATRPSGEAAPKCDGPNPSVNCPTPTHTVTPMQGFYVVDALIPLTQVDGLSEASVDCDAGDIATGGGTRLLPQPGYTNSMDINDRSYPKLTSGAPTGWSAQYKGNIFGSSEARAYAVCLDNTPVHVP